MRTVEAEGRDRPVCDRCGHIHYLNPKPVAGIIIERGGRVLLARRAIEPRYGTWTFPGGFVELDETVQEAAVREAEEEVGLRVTVGPLVGVYTRTGPGIVLVVFRAASFEGTPGPTDETLETAWFHHTEIPWEGLAFDSTVAALRDWAAAYRER